ncbi:MAG TPA: DUF3175 domain-containing protein [Myxococcales bacterium]|nr:DUF3175 domain-containing protein [Myxococcales bacterium]
MAKKAPPTKKGPSRTASGARKRTSASAPKSPPKKKGGATRWSQRVTETSDALDLPAGVFEKKSPRAVAASLKRSAEKSGRRKGTPYQSAMSMLTFFINRAGKQLGGARRQVLECAKRELRALFHRPVET